MHGLVVVPVFMPPMSIYRGHTVVLSSAIFSNGAALFECRYPEKRSDQLTEANGRGQFP